MRDDAARALRVDDDWNELRSIGSLLDVDLPPRMRRFEREPEAEGAAVVVLPERPARRAAVAKPRLEPRRERLADPVPAPRTAPGRAYGSHRRADGPAAARPTGAQPGRRTIAITGQAQPRRRPSQTSAALVAKPDRVALWAFLFALFLLAMAIATAHG